LVIEAFPTFYDSQRLVSRLKSPSSKSDESCSPVTLYFCKINFSISNYVNISKEESPSLEGNSSSARQEITCMSWNLKVYYLINENPALAHMLNQIDSVHALASCFFKKI
jgi:hypothetical protein